MSKNIVLLEIKHIPLEVENSELGMVELTDLATQIEDHMKQLQEDGEIDTLRQALLTALHFAARAYLNNQNEGGKRQEEEARVDSLISKLKTALDKQP